jgi:hypothetical protein
MLKFFRRRSPIILSFLIAAVIIFGAFAVFADHSWGGYHWARTTPEFTLQLGNNLTRADWQGHLSQASMDWNSGNTPILTAVVAGQSNRNCRMVAGTTQVCNAAYGQNGWLGLATINITGGTHITQGSAKMNDTYFSNNYAKGYYNNPNERQHVMCQEIAHTFGLDHQSEDGSSLNTCMDYFSNTGANATSTKSTKPNAHDFEELELIYAHVDSTTTVAARTTLAAGQVDGEINPNNWGHLKSQSRNGRSSTYERPNQDGSITLTHVFWTEEAAERCPSCDHRYDR